MKKIGTPYKRGEFYYFSKNDGLQNQSIIYRLKNFEEEEEIFLDPNKFSSDGTSSLAGQSFSKNNRYYAYATSTGGSDWRDIYILNVETKEKLPDIIKWAKFSSISWFKDGFYYQRFAEPKAGDELKGANKFGKIYYHKLGTSQEADLLVYENPSNPDNRFSTWVTEDERFLFIYSNVGTSGNELYVKDLINESSNFLPIITGFEKDHYVVATQGDSIILHTNFEAPNNRLVKLHFQNSNPSNWRTILPETENVMNASTAGRKIFASYLIDAKTSIIQLDYNGKKEREVELPGIGTAGGFDGLENDQEIFYTFTSFTYPTSVFIYSIITGQSRLHKRPNVDFDPEGYETKQIFYTSKDGTQIPMFIVHKKGLVMNSKNPTWLYSYGGFNISLTPSFSASRIIWLENGGVYAMPNIRGGGEYGEKWHKAGTKLQKKNVFDDFIAAAEYLIAEKYTSSDYLALQGGSNGGLLVGATVNMRPELSKVAFPQVGVMDMLRYQNFTIGRAWSVDYGTAEDSKEMFDYLYSYSPLHNIATDKAYPAIMVTTADHDDRVVPAHSFKYTATLQTNLPDNRNPLLIRVETNAGHGAGMSTEKRIELTTDLYSFAWYNMGVVPEFVKKNK